MGRTNPRWQWNNSGLRLLATSQSVLWVKRRRLQYKQACPLYASITDINHFFRAPWHVGLGEGHVYHQLTLRGMTGNVPLACRILRRHNAACGESADITIARLEFDIAG